MRSSSSGEVPDRFTFRSLDDFDVTTESQRKALRAARMMLSGENQGLVLVGPPGVGKTHLAAGIANAVAKGDQDVYVAQVSQVGTIGAWPRVPEPPLWINLPSAMVALRREFGMPPEECEVTRLLHDAGTFLGLVVLDDLGREKVTDWTGEQVYALVNARYERRLRTIVTTNLTPEELKESPHWPVVSRLAEDGALVLIDGRDYRLKAKATHVST